jgi:hypothetical protein
MSTEVINQRLRQFLLLLSGFTLLMTLVELLLAEHTGEALQVLPLMLAALGIVALLLALLRPGRASLIALRLVMLLVGLTGALGAAVHLLRNYEFEQEIRPNAAASELVMHTLQGAAPLLAPGVLLFAALVALAATYYHPLLIRPDSP